MPNKCYICEKEYTYKRNLTRHTLEKHFINKQWGCSEGSCCSKFFRRSNLVRHLCLTHKYSTAKARSAALNSNEKNNNNKQKASICGYYEDLTSAESILDLHAELDAMEEEEAIRQFDLEPYKNETDDMTYINENN